MTFPCRLGPACTIALFCGLAGLPAPGQRPTPPDSGCVQQRGSYICNWSNFKLAFERAHTVAVQTDPMDRPTAHQVDALLSELGKARASEGAPADLTMLLIPIEPTGVSIGPMDHELATLRIYAPVENNPRGTLLWAETLKGQGDRPWHAQVHALIAQFQDRLQKQR